MSIINTILSRFFGAMGNKSKKDISEVQPIVEKINEINAGLSQLSNDELREKSRALKDKVAEYIREEREEIQKMKDQIDREELPVEETEKLYHSIDKIEKQITEKLNTILEEILPEAFAIVKETARRFKENDVLKVTAQDFDRDLAATRQSIKVEGDTALWYNKWIAGGTEIIWDMIHYDVQLIGGIVLHRGTIAEMATGEGKTLVATLPVFLNALSGRGVHIVTVNDYLAKRDSEWMGPIFEFHGLLVDCIDKHQPNSDGRRKAYKADITFGTNNEYGFDYLRDNMAIRPEDLVQRGHNFAIVDEVDSVLIDDARTPLIISGPVPKGEDQLFEELKPKVMKLVNAQKKLITDVLVEAKKLISENKNEEGGKLLLRAFKGLPKNNAIIKYLSEQGIKMLMLKTENLYMQNNSKDMYLVTDELYFIIDEKHNSIELTEKGIDLITGSSDDPTLFVLPDIGSEVAEIEKNISDPAEKVAKKDLLLRDYAIKSERVHTINQLLKAYSLFEKDVEYVVMDNKVKIVDEQTGRILDGRRYSDGLHQAIEAKENVKVEAATQTFATITLQNYFRMYNKLSGMTGTAETEAGELWDIYKTEVVVIPTNKPIVREDFEDLVYKTKREKYNAVIDEIVNLINKGRPVLVGTTSVEVSELLSRMLKMRQIKHNVLNAKLHQREADIVAEAGRSKTVTIATNMAGRGTDIKLTEETRKSGGLAIVGTERHESRRVDRQLRGRAGRQGDPGTSQFFVSLEDDLMRLFGSDRIAKLMDRMGLKEGEVIQHSLITRSIERAQRKVEENNFGIRKRLLEYDNVMNSQREVIYTRRRHALLGERLEMDISNMMYDVCESIVKDNHGITDYDEFNMALIRFLSIESPVNREDYLQMDAGKIVEEVFKSVAESFKRKTEAITKQAFPVIRQVFEKQSKVYENIVVPISDGARVFHVVTNLKKAYDNQAREVVRSYEKTAILITIDELWKEHLREMDDLKQSVQNAAYEQKDPLLIYKFESFGLFQKMLDEANKDVSSTLMKAFIPIQDAGEVKEARTQRADMSRLKTSRPDSTGRPEARLQEPPQGHQQEGKTEPVRVEKKAGRNDPCPCGSGKKYKQCHGQSKE